MGKVKLYLCKDTMKEREFHNSRLFIDICENIHIHYREYRFVFSVDEFLEFAAIIEGSKKDISNFLRQNSDYTEQKHKDAFIIAGGGKRQFKLLRNSPKPHESRYFNLDLAIELQEEGTLDQIHIHYRDLRVVLNRENFNLLAENIIKAREKLIEFEKTNKYIQKRHPDREIFKEDTESINSDFVMGTKNIPIEHIVSPYHKDLIKDWKTCDHDYIGYLINELKIGNRFAPIIVSRTLNKKYVLILGHHRLYAAKKFGLKEITCVIVPFTHKETENLRKVEILLKEFDMKTDYKYHLSAFYQDYLGFKLNRFYSNFFKKRFSIVRFTKDLVKKILGWN